MKVNYLQHINIHLKNASFKIMQRLQTPLNFGQNSDDVIIHLRERRLINTSKIFTWIFWNSHMWKNTFSSKHRTVHKISGENTEFFKWVVKIHPKNDRFSHLKPTKIWVSFQNQIFFTTRCITSTLSQKVFALNNVRLYCIQKGSCTD